MNILRKIMKVIRESPMRIPHYLLHYTRLYIRRKTSKYSYLNSEKYLNKSIQKIYKMYNVTSKEELFDKIKLDKRNVFLIQDTETVLSEIRQDTEYANKIIYQADLALNNTFLILNENYDNMYDHGKGHYKWFVDYVTGYEFKISHYTLAQRINNLPNNDIKRVWEIARMQYLFAPSLAYALTHDEKYAQKVKHIIMDFIEQNPPGIGPNWNVSMEVGIRVSNMILAFELIRTANCIDSDFIARLFASVYNHYIHISKNEENVGGKTYNHYLGGLLGISACNTLLPFDRRNKISEYLLKSLKKELDRQVLDDGADFEGSLSYQRLAGELFSFTVISSSNNSIKLPKEYLDRLLSMANYTYEIMQPSGYIPQIGDNDSGRVFQLIQENLFDQSSFINLIFGICKKQALFPDKKDGFILFTGILPEARSLKNLNQRLILKKESYVAKIKHESITIYTSAVDAQRFGMGSHTHNDALSFELWFEDVPFIVDPGTGCYTSNTAMRDMFRSVKSHSTISIDGREQKVLKENSIFQWFSSVKTSLYQKDENENILEGNVIYEKGLVHLREFDFRNSEKIIIKDRIIGDVKELSCNMVLHPDVVIESAINDKCIILSNGNSKIEIEGSWRLTVDDWFFSPQYDVIVPCKKIIATSNNNINDFNIRGIYRNL